VRLVAHYLESRPRTEGADFGICQTFAASPAEPGELPCWFSGGMLKAESLFTDRQRTFVAQPCPSNSISVLNKMNIARACLISDERLSRIKRQKRISRGGQRRRLVRSRQIT
jgi:hypothetical protein